MNNPLQNNETGVTCLVKVYDEFDSFKINDIVEFIGILSTDPTLAFCNSCLNQQKLQDKNTIQDGNNMEIDSELTNYLLSSHREQLNNCSCSFAPPSLVPRIHNIKSIHLKHNNPLLGNIYSDLKLSTSSKLNN